MKLFVLDLLIPKKGAEEEELNEAYEKLKKVCEDISKKDETFKPVYPKIESDKFLVIKIFGSDSIEKAQKRGRWFISVVNIGIEFAYKVHVINN